MANDAENNRSKAKALLNRNAEFASEIIASKIKLIDASGRQFLSELSPFQYAYWAGDIKMCLLLLDFLNPEDSKNVLEECLQQDAVGLDYQQNQNIYQNVVRFDFKPLYTAYENYIFFCQEVFKNKLLNQSDTWQQMLKLFYNIGLEQTKVPVSLAQELCSPQEFKNIDEFKTALKDLSIHVKTSTKVINPDTQTDEYWFIGGRYNSRLGQEMSFFKFRPQGPNITSVCENKSCHFSFSQLDLEAFKAIEHQRFEIDRLELMEKMQASVKPNH